MKRIESYLNKYRVASPVWGVFRRDFADFLSNTTGESVLKGQIVISGKKIHLRGISTALRVYIKTHSTEVNSFIQTFPDTKYLHL